MISSVSETPGSGAAAQWPDYKHRDRVRSDLQSRRAAVSLSAGQPSCPAPAPTCTTRRLRGPLCCSSVLYAVWHSAGTGHRASGTALATVLQGGGLPARRPPPSTRDAENIRWNQPPLPPHSGPLRPTLAGLAGHRARWDGHAGGYTYSHSDSYSYGGVCLQSFTLAVGLLSGQRGGCKEVRQRQGAPAQGGPGGSTGHCRAWRAWRGDMCSFQLPASGAERAQTVLEQRPARSREIA